jgi:hypothetical protein
LSVNLFVARAGFLLPTPSFMSDMRDCDEVPVSL